MSAPESTGTSSPQLLYIADPMCSWCFAFAPILQRVREDLVDGVQFRLILGGLAEDDEEPMSAETSEYIRGAWRSIEARTPVRFNWEYWERCTPRRSTWPACRAVLAAGVRGEEMFEAIQQAYYQGARDPSDLGVLADIAEELGFARQPFAIAIQSPEMRRELLSQFEQRRQIGARAFPSIAVRRAADVQLLTSGWVEEAGLRAVLAREGLLASR